MSPVLSLALAMAFPFALLAMILWLCRLEESLPADIRRTRRTPDPEPILRVPVRARPLPQPLLHQGLLVDAVLEPPEPAGPEQWEPAVPEQTVPRPVVPADLDVPPQRSPERQVPTGTR
ncbi:MAG: hypothetical protein ACTHOK_03550 [Nocardioidaceae bacterium]